MRRMTGLFVLLAVIASVPTVAEAQRVKQARVPRAEPTEWTDAQKAVLGSRNQGDKTAPIWKTCLQHTELCKAWLPWTSYLLGRTLVPPRDKELLILRVAWLSKADYPWAGHYEGGKRAGLTEEEIARIPKGPDAPGWSKFDAALLRAADELHRDQFVSDATWKALDEKYDERQYLETVFIVGQYLLLSMYTNSAGIQLDHGPALPK
jgi:4-carboxymuconolactone decarboxylase